MLFRWNFLVSRAKVLKYLSVNTDNFRDVEYVTECTNCSRVTKAPLCKECRIPLLNCVLCRLPVRGLANACLNCGHGGHTIHMKNWFKVRLNLEESISSVYLKFIAFFLTLQKNDHCASGCGCPCLNFIFK